MKIELIKNKQNKAIFNMISFPCMFIGGDQFCLMFQFYQMKHFPERKELWRENSTTIGFVSPEYSFSQEKRFEKFSIYSNMKSIVSADTFQKKKTDLNQVAKRISLLIDIEEKNQKRLGKSNKTSLQKLSTSLQNQTSTEGFSTQRSASHAKNNKNIKKQSKKVSLFYSTQCDSPRKEFSKRKITKKNNQQRITYIKFKERTNLNLTSENPESQVKKFNDRKINKIRSSLLETFMDKMRNTITNKNDK